MKKTLIVNAALVAGILAASAIGTVHAGQASPDYQIGYQNGYNAGVIVGGGNEYQMDMNNTGTCALSLRGTAMQVWHIGYGAFGACHTDSKRRGFRQIGTGGIISSDTVCWWTDSDDRMVTLVQDSGTMSRGIGYCNANEPK